MKKKLLAFYKKHKLLSIFLTIFLILVFIPIFFLLSKWVSLTGPVDTTRHYPEYIKGFWGPAGAMFMTGDGINYLKEELNMNVFAIGPGMFYSSPIREIINMCMLSVIKEAKNQGVAVYVAMECHGPGFSNPSDSLTNEDLEVWADRVVEWARICEEYGVEYFSPASEADHCMGRDRAIEWYAKVLPRVREVFSGKVLAQWSTWSNDDSADDIVNNNTEAYVYRVQASKDFDGVILDLGQFEPWRYKYFLDLSKKLEEGNPWLPSSLEEIVLATSQVANELGLPIYMGEVSMTGTDPLSEWAKKMGMQPEDSPAMTEEEAAEYFSKVLDTIIPYYNGVIVTPWPGDCLPTQVIAEKFGTI